MATASHLVLLGPPFVDRGAAHAMLATQLRYRHAVLHLPQDTHDLGFSETCLIHRTPRVHFAEKILLPHPLKIRGITRGLQPGRCGGLPWHGSEIGRALGRLPGHLRSCVAGAKSALLRSKVSAVREGRWRIGKPVQIRRCPRNGKTRGISRHATGRTWPGRRDIRPRQARKPAFG